MSLPGILRKIKSHSWREIRFRIGQECSNLRLCISPPVTSDGLRISSLPLPDPVNVANRLKRTAFAAECLGIADEVMRHRFPILGITLETGPEIRWRCDYASGVETSAIYFRRIPYLDALRAGDHKSIWEINRHQHLVLLAQAHLFSGQPDFLYEIVRQLESWFEQNPFQRGINWASALEVAFRALSWIWVYHLAGDRLPASFRARFLEELYRHGLHIETNLSYYFAPNTHLLGEAVVLHALGCLFPRCGRWKNTGACVVRNELERQVRADGLHFEQSPYYHVYAFDMFLFHAILHGLDDVYRNHLTRMAEILDALLGVSGVLPFLGDDDGGRFFHPYGERNRFALATLATCGVFLHRPEWVRGARYLEEQAAWWLGEEPVAATPAQPQPRSTRFADSGLIVMAAGDVQLIVDCGPFGPGNAGHSHADTLSFVLRQGDEQLLIDPGTYTYVGDAMWRNRFRGTAAHNTVRIDGLDQAIPSGPFAWKSHPEIEVLRWESSDAGDLLVAACSYAGFRHQRTIRFNKNALWIRVSDRVENSAGEHHIEQFWHLGASVRRLSPACFQIGTKAVMILEENTQARLFEGEEYGWISPALQVKSPSPVVSVAWRTSLPASFTTLIDLSGKIGLAEG